MTDTPHSSSDETILVFPGGMERSLRFARRSEAALRRLIGASSLRFDPAQPNYDDWTWLPEITEPGFDDALRDILEQNHVRAIFTPHPVIGTWLEQHLAEVAPGVRLIHDSLLDSLNDYRHVDGEIAALRSGGWDLAGPAPQGDPLDDTEAAGLLRLADGVPGQCAVEKIWALAEIARRTPPGDLVEIGSLWGKSAVAFAWLARRYGLGLLLCVDPWSADSRHQYDNGGQVNEWSDRMDFDLAFDIFRTNLAMMGRDSAGYLRAPSAQAAALYGPGLTTDDPALGRTEFGGTVALLHIDGNHDEAFVAEDLRLWAPKVVPGGWMVLDDYCWAFGDGPCRVGDRFLAERGEEIAASFVAGSALFVRLA